MSTISPKQIDFSQPISGSLIPYTGSGETVSDFNIGSPSQSWGHAYLAGLTVSGGIDISTSNFSEITVSTLSRLSGSVEITGSSTTQGDAVITGSLKISGSIQLDGDINIQNLGSLGDRDDNLVMDLGGFF